MDLCDIEEFCGIENHEETIAILGDRLWPQTAEQDECRTSKQYMCRLLYERSVMSVQTLEFLLVKYCEEGMRGQWSNDQASDK